MSCPDLCMRAWTLIDVGDIPLWAHFIHVYDSESVSLLSASGEANFDVVTEGMGYWLTRATVRQWSLFHLI